MLLSAEFARLTLPNTKIGVDPKLTAAQASVIPGVSVIRRDRSFDR